MRIVDLLCLSNWYHLLTFIIGFCISNSQDLLFMWNRIIKKWSNLLNFIGIRNSRVSKYLCIIYWTLFSACISTESWSCFSVNPNVLEFLCVNGRQKFGQKEEHLQQESMIKTITTNTMLIIIVNEMLTMMFL